MRAGVLIPLILAGTLASAPPGPAIRTARMKADLFFLTSRAVGSRAALDRGSDIAAEYIATEFARAGLVPFDGKTYLQPFSITEFRGNPASTALLLERGGSTHQFRVMDDFRGVFHNAVTRSGALVFAGYGVTAPERKYDDYTGIDAHGKVVLLFEHEPWEVKRGLGVHGNLTVKLRNAEKHGAVAVLVAPEPKRTHRSQFDPPLAPPARARGSARPATLGSIDVPYFYLTEETTAKLLEGTRYTASELQAEIQKTLRPRSFEISGAKITARTGLSSVATGQTSNVIGILEGSDPVLKNEFVLVTSHYDHLPDREGNSYPGANDNGSGTVAMLEIARAFAAGPRPRRSLIFASFGAEENLLLGSWFYTAYPVRPLGATRVVLNLDMVGRNEETTPETKGRVNVPTDTRDMLNLVGIKYSPDLKRTLDKHRHAAGLTLDTRYDLDLTQSTMYRCDHFPFLAMGIPAVWLFGGWHVGYHTLSDTVEHLDFDKLERVVRLTYLAAREIADSPRPPRFQP